MLASSLYTRHLCRRVYSFRLSIRIVVSLFLCLVDFVSKFNFGLSFKRSISHERIVRNHSYFGHRYLKGLALFPSVRNLLRGQSPKSRSAIICVKDLVKLPRIVYFRKKVTLEGDIV